MSKKILAPITRKNVLDALQIIARDFESIPAARRRTNWLLYHEGRTYPPKYVISVASTLADMEPLQWNHFYGGQPTNSFLKALGFDIQATPAHAERIAKKAAG